MNIESQILEQIKKSNLIVITAHKSPDGDSIGSSLALFEFIKKITPNVFICHPDVAPKYLSWLDNSDKILNYENHADKIENLFNTADLIFSLDYNDPSRLGEKMGNLLNNSSAFKIMIDHHLNPSDFANIKFSDTNSCSTCQLIFELLENSNSKDLLDKRIGTSIYLGIMTDTGSFRFSSVKSKTHRIIAELLDVGVENNIIHEQLNDVNTLDRLKLIGFATSEKLVVLPELQTAYISLNEKELNQFNYEKGDTEGLVNIALSIVGVKIAAFFSEKDGLIKISFRSKGKDNPINVLASENFEGGGHANASGGKFEGTIEDAVSKFITILPKYVS